jgi:outer membrane protein assembly factor BamD
LRMKLETKAYNNAKLYYKTSDYKAAFTALQNVIVDFPATVYKEVILYLIFRSSYLFAINSIESKQLQRLKDARENYLKLVDAFPQSEYLQEAERSYNDINGEIKRRESRSANN